MRVGIYLLSVFDFAVLYFFVRDSEQMIYEARKLAIFCGVFHLPRRFARSLQRSLCARNILKDVAHIQRRVFLGNFRVDLHKVVGKQGRNFGIFSIGSNRFL